MNTNPRLIALLLGLAGIAGLALTNNRGTPRAAPVKTAFKPQVTVLKPIPVVKRRPESPAVEDERQSWSRNLFIYADVPPTPAAPPPPPPPPPPPEIKPESRLLGTVYENQLLALFSLKGEVSTMREGDLLENKFIVKRIESEAVVLEHATHHNTAVIAVGGSK